MYHVILSTISLFKDYNKAMEQRQNQRAELQSKLDEMDKEIRQLRGKKAEMAALANEITERTKYLSSSLHYKIPHTVIILCYFSSLTLSYMISLNFYHITFPSHCFILLQTVSNG